MQWWHGIAIWYFLASAATFLAFAIDKHRAARNGVRISERALQLFALLGGWPGAHLARMTLRHKNRKTGFGFMLWTITMLHLAVWIGVAITS
jgi:uncharacterized membrane protein YsdA (DUF1294 family)